MTQGTCKLDGCDRPPKNGRGWCNRHYKRWLKTGDPGPVESLRKPPTFPFVVDGVLSRECSKCGEVKPLETGFNRLASAKSGRQSYCKSCAVASIREWKRRNPIKVAAAEKRRKERWPDYGADYARLRAWGMSRSDYDDMLKSQDGTCAICDGPPQQKGRYHVDHDHETGKIRGLLCMSCNRGIGYLKDDIQVLTRAMEYLHAHFDG